jgi:hypothetical protein
LPVGEGSIKGLLGLKISVWKISGREENWSFDDIDIDIR